MLVAIPIISAGSSGSVGVKAYREVSEYSQKYSA